MDPTEEQTRTYALQQLHAIDHSIQALIKEFTDGAMSPIYVREKTRYIPTALKAIERASADHWKHAQHH